MTDTRSPLVHRSLSAENRMASELVRMLDKGTVTVDAPYQRISVWTVEQQQGLVKSWLLGVPIPAIIVNDRMNGPWWDGHPRRDREAEPFYSVIDGKQRLLAARAWFSGELRVPAWWFADGEVEVAHVDRSRPGEPTVAFTGLTEVGQSRFEFRAPLPVAMARLGSVEEEAEVYLLVNSAGTAQTPADLERAAAVAAGQQVPIFETDVVRVQYPTDHPERPGLVMERAVVLDTYPSDGKLVVILFGGDGNFDGRRMVVEIAYVTVTERGEG